MSRRVVSRAVAGNLAVRRRTTLRLMRYRVPPALAVVAVALVASVVFALGSVASAGPRIPRCSVVRASGGDYNGGGGTMFAEVTITNAGMRTCTISGRPWIRLPRLAHPVTVEDWSGDPLAGSPGTVVTLSPRQHARAFILIIPGSCDRGVNVSFLLQARAGWRSRGVAIRGIVCDNGSGQVAVGSFKH